MKWKNISTSLLMRTKEPEGLNEFLNSKAGIEQRVFLITYMIFLAHKDVHQALKD